MTRPRNFDFPTDSTATPTLLTSKLGCTIVPGESTGRPRPTASFSRWYSSRLETVVGALCVTHEQSCELPRDMPEKLRLPHGLDRHPYVVDEQTRLRHRARQVNWLTPPNGKFQRVASFTFPTSRGGAPLRWKQVLGRCV